MTSSDVWYICDDFNCSPASAGVVVAWDAFADGANQHFSLPTIIRNDPTRYRDELLRFLRQVETSAHGGHDLIDALRMDGDMSYWWMTLVFAKRWGGLGVLPDAVKMLALAELLADHQPRRVVVSLSNARAHRSVVSTAQMLGIAHESTNSVQPQQPKLAWVRAVRTLVSAYRPTSRMRSQTACGTLVADYLFRLHPSSLNGGPFRSQYWAHLPDHLEDGVLWLHRYTSHPAISTRRKARQLVSKFNKDTSSDRHVLLDDLHGIREVRRALQTYRSIRQLRDEAPSIAANFRTTQADLWPIFHYDWTESFQGSHAMSMAILMTSLESEIKSLMNPTRGLYIFENQPWETPLVHAWRKHHKKPLIAVPHSTIRFWDLRYFVSSETLADSRFARADTIAANSELARTELLAGGWTEKMVTEVEALMYLYLDSQDTEPRNSDGIVILGELDHYSTQRYLNFVKQVIDEFPGSPNVHFKAHPLTDASAFDIAGTRATVSTEPVEALLRRAKVLITGASGSTVLEALTRGIPTICVLDPRELDLSTIRQHPLLRQVGSAHEFNAALRDLMGRSSNHTTEAFFHTDSTLKRWGELLQSTAMPQ